MSKENKKLKNEEEKKTSLPEEEQEIENQNKETENLQEETEIQNETEKIKEELKKEIEESLKEEFDKKTGEYITHIQRLQADFDNYKKQSEKQQRDLISFANEGLLLKILEVYEDFERAINNCKTEKEYSEGLELIYKKLTTMLEKEGIQTIPTENEKFDPYKHEAMMAENNEEYENGMIIDELSKGYTLKDKVIKYSMVKVCKK